jgi:hypothetical protein
MRIHFYITPIIWKQWKPSVPQQHLRAHFLPLLGTIIKNEQVSKNTPRSMQHQPYSQDRNKDRNINNKKAQKQSLTHSFTRRTPVFIMTKSLLFLVFPLLSVVSATRPIDWGLSRTAPAIYYHPSRPSSSTLLVSSRKKKNSKVAQAVVVPEEEPTAAGPLTNALVGGLLILGTTAVEYATGFIGAYVLGTVVGVPGIIYSKENLAIKTRFVNMNARSMTWAKSWAPISAVFAGCDTATRVVRGNVKDQWNTVISSAAAGAYFSRKGMINCMGCNICRVFLFANILLASTISK